MHFRFWGTCKEHAGLLHRYIHGNVVCGLHPHHLYLALLPMLSLPNSPSPTVPLLVPPNRPQGVMLHSLYICVLIIQHPPMSEFDFLFLCQVAENDGFQIHPCPYKEHELIVLYVCIVFHGVYVPHFPCPLCHLWAFGLVPGLCYCKQCCNEHTCACVFIIKQLIIL